MRLDNALFTTQNAELPKEPRYVISIDFDGTVQYLTSHDDIANVPGTPIQNCIAGISATSQTLNPDRANATIGSMNFNIVDLASAFTDKVRLELDTNDVGLRGRTVAFYMGYKSDQEGAGILDGGSTDDNPDFDNFVLFQTQIVQKVTTKEAIYTVHCADIQRETKKQLFELALTYLTSSITATDTTIPCLDISGFEGNAHGTSYTDAPSADVIYVQLDKTKEIIRCPVSGISGNSFTGVTRAVFGTTAQAVEVDPASASNRRPKVEEYVYLELPCVKLAYALLTGVIHGTADVLPSGWHAGVPTSFVRLTDFENIGADLWDTTDDAEGVVLRFDGIEKFDAKGMLETQIYLLVGLFSPVYADGQLGLKRMVPSLSDSPASFVVSDSNVKAHGNLSHDMDAMLNNMRVDWNWNGDRYIRSTIIADSGSIARHGEAHEKRMQFRGLVGARFTEQVLRQLMTSLRDMYTAPPLRLDVQGFHLLNQVEVGDAGKVQLSSIRDYSQPGASLDRTMVVHGMTIDWLGGVKLKLFGSAERADEIPPITATTCLPDAFYPSEGASLSATPGLMTGNATNTGSFTLVGSADMNAAASIFYWDNDLTISSDTTLNIEGNVQLRVKGFLTINGTIDGVAEGIAASGDDGYTAGQHYYWANDTPLGVSGFIGNSMAHMGLLFRYPNDGGIPDWVWATRKTPATVGRHQAFPNLILAVTDTGNGSITGIPTDMRGGSGSYGSPAGEKTGLSGRTYQRAAGGIGGAGGAALCVVCRGGDFGVSGQITLDGEDSTEPTAFYAEQGNDYDIYGGSGGAGAPGSLLWLLDGSAVQFPDLAGHFQAKTGIAPAQYALPRVGDQGQWYNQSLSENNRPRKNMAPFNPDVDISDFDQTGVNFRISYLPCDITPEDDQETIVPSPTGLVSTEANAGVQLNWTNPEDIVIAVDIFRSDRQLWSSAVKIAETESESWLDPQSNVERGARYYWVQGRDVFGNVSVKHPDNDFGVFGRPKESRQNWCLDPEFDIGNPTDNWTGNGNGSQTEFWRANLFPNGATATADHQPTGGEAGDTAIDLRVFGKGSFEATGQLQSKKFTRFQTNKSIFQFVIKYKTVGSVDALDHTNFLTYIRTAAQEFGGGVSASGGDRVTLPRSVGWNTVTLQQKVNSIGFNFIGWQIGFVDGEFNTHDALRVDSVFVYQVGGDEFGDNVQATDVQAGLVPKATSAQSGQFLRGDGTWQTPGGGAGTVTSFNTRTGAVVPILADYDSFFLTPAEGNAAYQPLGTYVNTFEGRSGAVVAAAADYADVATSYSVLQTFNAGIAMADNLLTRPWISDFAIQHQNVSGVASTTINYSSGQSILLTMAANITTMTINNWPGSGRLGQLQFEIKQDSTARTIAWPAGIQWATGSPPDLSDINETYTVLLSTRDGGSTITGTFAWDSSPGVSTGFQGLGIWRHRTETATPPGSGQIRFNNANPVLATSMFVHETNDGGTDMANFLALIDDGGIIYLQDRSNANNFFAIEVSSYTDSGVYVTFGIENIVLEGAEPGQNTQVALVASEAQGGNLVASVFGRTGVVTALQADYDSFFLTPAEGNAAYAPLAHVHSGADITSGIVAAARIDTAIARLAGPTFSGTSTFNGTVQLADNILNRAHFSDFAIEHQVVAAIASTTINYTAGQSVLLNMGAVNITTLTLSNWPASGRLGQMQIEINQHSTPKTIQWPAAVTWQSGAPDLSTPSADYVINLSTRDGGTSIIGSYIADSASPVTSIFGRTGVVTALQADYDSFFLTPAEGNAAYATVGHQHTAFDRASSVLSGANVFSNLVVTNGIITAIATRALTAANIGAAPLVHSHTGSTISALDAGDTTTGIFALARIPTTVARLASPTFSGTVSLPTTAMGDSRLERAYLDDYAVQHQNVTAIASTTLNYSSGQSVRLTLAGVNITTFAVSNWPATNRKGVMEIELKQGATLRTIAWPAAINWPGGVAPDIATVNGRFLIYLTTTNAGTNIDGTYTEALS